MSKRKHEASEETVAQSLLFVQAYEADIFHGPKAVQAARSLEVSSAGSAGDGLIKCITTEPEAKCIWVDRYDARLLLDTLLKNNARAEESSSSSQSGWADLPSDSEDTFFFTSEEVEDYRRDKRRKLLTQAHAERVKAIEAEENLEPEESWGASDEEPDESQKELMKRTAEHLISSPNAAQLEMRILANHGADKRFAFLRGRWSRFWKLTKIQLIQGRDQTKDAVGLGGIAGYGSDESESEVPSAVVDDEATIKEARRVRLREWSEKRREVKNDNDINMS